MRMGSTPPNPLAPLVDNGRGWAVVGAGRGAFHPTQTACLVGLLLVWSCGDGVPAGAPDPFQLDTGTADTIADLTLAQPCDADSDCEAGFHCQPGGDQCVPDRCREDEDCDPGSRCLDRDCVPVDEAICDSESTLCEGNTLVRCSGDGMTEDRTDCDDLVCLEADEDARCAERICSPFEAGCLDPETAFSCDGTGAVLSDFPCAEGRYCDEGSCRDQACEPDSAICQGNVAVVCDELGASSTTIVCSEEATCVDSGFGCSCQAGTCEVRVCQPSTASCIEGARHPCAADGLSLLEPETCDDDEVCVAGECLPEVCQPGALTCAAEILLECNTDGTTRDETDCAATDQICEIIDESAECADTVCEPDASECNEGGTTVATCDARGASTEEIECRLDQHCAGGACVTDLCVQGSEARCVEDDVKRCSATGSGFVLVQDCDDETQHCREGACHDVVCQAGVTFCSADVQVECSADGTSEQRTNCVEQSSYCNHETASCASWVCTPSSSSCEHEVVRECNARGSSELTTNCADADMICVVGEDGPACENRVCLPNSTSCDEPRTAVLICDSRGASASATPCGESKHCSGGSCIDDVCVPGSGDVCSDGDVRRCDTIGSGYVLVEACDHESERCIDGACATPQRPVAVLTVSATEADSGEDLTFDASASYHPGAPDHQITSMSLNFGNGTSVTLPEGGIVEFSYTTPGTYTATLTVADDQRLTGTDSATLTIGEEPECDGSPNSCGLGQWCDHGTCESCTVAEHCGLFCFDCQALDTSNPVCGGLTEGCVCTEGSCGNWQQCNGTSCELCATDDHCESGCLPCGESTPSCVDRGDWSTCEECRSDADCEDGDVCDIDHECVPPQSCSEPPLRACQNGIESGESCEDAIIIDREDAADGAMRSGDLTDAHDNDSSCTNATGGDLFYRVFMMAGEVLTVHMDVDSFDGFDPVVAIHRATAECVGAGCDVQVLCEDDGGSGSDVQTTGYVAGATGWYVIQADAFREVDSEEDGSFILNMDLTCLEADCGC